MADHLDHEGTVNKKLQAIYQQVIDNPDCQIKQRTHKVTKLPMLSLEPYDNEGGQVSMSGHDAIATGRFTEG